MKWFSFLHRGERRDISSAEFEAAVNKVITADTVADATRLPYITEEDALNLTAGSVSFSVSGVSLQTS